MSIYNSTPATGFSVLQERRPGMFDSFYWAADRAEAEQNAEITRALFPTLNIVVRDNANLSAA